MRLAQTLAAALTLTAAAGCSDTVHAPWRIRFPADGSLACSTGVEIWIKRGGCDADATEIYRAGFVSGTRPRELETLPPGRYGFAARAHDGAGNWFAEGCAVVSLPHEDGTPIEVALERTGSPLDCGAVDGGLDGGLARDGGLDAGPGMDAGLPDAGSPTDAGRDTGGADPCAVDMASAAAAATCNGPIRGPAADDQFGGHCLAGGSARGSCADPADECLQCDRAGNGYCARPCPVAPTYSSTGGCPTGSRCFPVEPGYAFCFPDCLATTDCTGGLECYADRACGCPPP